MQRLARVSSCLLVLSMVACGKPGESWAKKRFGADGAERLRAEAARHVGLTESAGGGEIMKPPDKAGYPSQPYLPRPYVVFLHRGWAGAGGRAILEFHPASEDQLGGEAAASEAGARGLVVVEEDNRCEGGRTKKGACRGPQYGVAKLTLIDRTTGTVTTSETHGLDKATVFGALRTLPASR